jgi:hypothetical protein
MFEVLKPAPQRPVHVSDGLGGSVSHESYACPAVFRASPALVSRLRHSLPVSVHMFGCHVSTPAAPLLAATSVKAAFSVEAG